MSTTRMASALCVILAMTLAVASSATAQPTVTLSVTPSEIDRGDVFVVTVQTSVPGVAFNVTLSDEYGRTVSFANRTDALGVWSAKLGYPLDFGEWTVIATVSNETGAVVSMDTAYMKVGCGGQCISDVMTVRFVTYETFLLDLFTRGMILFLALWAVIELPRTAIWGYREGDKARKEGRITPREILTAPVSGIRTFIAPSRQGTIPKANERIAVDLERRQKLDELHRITNERFWEYDPEHVTRIRTKVDDLTKIMERQRSISTHLPRARNKYVEPTTARVASVPTELGTLAAIGQFADEPEPRAARTGEAAAMASVIAKTMRRARTRSRARRWVAIAAFLAIGVPGILMVAFMLLASVGVYVDAVRPLWTPWPPEGVKIAGGLAAFSLTLFAVALTSGRRD